MNKIWMWIAGLCFLGVQLCADEIPVAPITPIDFKGKQAYELKNENLRAVFIPEMGRMVHVSYQNSSNLVTQRLDATGDWKNIGGNWLFPMAQDEWEAPFGKNWPPAPLLDGTPWTGHAWVSVDGAQHMMLIQHYAEPINAKCTRHITLYPKAHHLVIKHRLERTAFSEVPLCIWTLNQIPAPDQVFWPTSSPKAAPMFGDTLSEKELSYTNSMTIFTPETTGETKQGIRSKDRWIAARQQDVLMLMALKETTRSADLKLPEDGQWVQLYYHQDLGYAEIELLSHEANLPPGKSLEDIRILSFHTVPHEKTPQGVLEQFFQSTEWRTIWDQ